MQKFIILILFILPVHILYGQYEYFNEVYQFEEGFNEITANVFVLEDNSYLTYNLTNTSEGRKFIFRNIDNEGLVISEDTVSFEQFFFYIPGLTGSIIQTDNSYVWGGQAQGSESFGALTAQFNRETYEKEWELYLESDTLTSKKIYMCNELSDGNILFSGGISHDIDDDVWYEYENLYLVKVNTFGDTLWTREIPNETSYDFSQTNQIFELENNDIVLFGQLYHDQDNAIFHLTPIGELISIYSWGIEDMNDFTPMAIQEANTLFTIAYFEPQSIFQEGSMMSFNKPHLRRFDLENNELHWDFEYEHEMLDLAITDIIRTPDNGYALVGIGQDISGLIGFYCCWILKTDSLGNEEWFKKYNYTTIPTDDFTTDIMHDIELTIDGGFILAGYHSYGGQNSWLLKLDACGELEDLGCPFTIDIVENNTLETGFSVYPNPISDILNISFPQNINEILNLRVYNSLGALVYSSKLSSGIKQTEVDVSHFSEGVYILQIVNEDGVLLGREVFEKL